MTTIKKIAILAAIILLAFCLSSCQKAGDYESKYKLAVDRIAEGKYSEAASLLEGFGSYEEATKLSMYCRAVDFGEKGDYQSALTTFRNLSGYMDSDLMYVYYSARSEMSLADNKDYEPANQYISAAKIFLINPLFRNSKELADSCYKSAYDYAKKLISEKRYYQAIDDLELLEDYLDSPVLIKQARADSYYDAGNLAEAWEYYRGLDKAYQTHASDYAAKYKAASEKMENEEYEEAAAGFKELGNYENSKYLSHECTYLQAKTLMENAEYENASVIFKTLNEYKDSADLAAECTYLQAKTLMKNAEYENASAIFKTLGKYKDSTDLATECTYLQAKTLMENAEYENARTIFRTLREYRDSADLVTECRYLQAKVYLSEGKYNEAVDIFEDLGKYKDCATLIIQAGADALYDEGMLADAWTIYANLPEEYRTHEQDYEDRYLAAAGELSKSDFDSAREHFLEISYYKNSAEKATDALYQKAAYLKQKGNLTEAAALYLSLRDYLDSREKHYLIGKEQKDSDPVIASSILLEDMEYKDTKDILYEIADKASGQEQYPLSVSLFDKLGAIKDCKLRMKNDLYLYGRQLMENGQNDIAAYIFDRVSGIGSADLYANMARYAAAEKLEEDGSYEKAASAFALIAGYSDAKDRSIKCRYEFGIEEKTAANYENAISIFDSLGEYEDSAEQKTECCYLFAGQYEDSGDWNNAISRYKALGEYKDSPERGKSCYNSLGEDQLAAGNADSAYKCFTLGESLDGQARAAYAIAERKVADFDLEGALAWYQKASELPETETRTAMIASILLNMEEDALSEQYASIVIGSEKSREILYALAIRSLERQDEDTAMRQMQMAGDSADASERFKEMLNSRVKALVANEKYDEAANLCASYGDQEQADALLKEKAEKAEAEKQRLAEANRAEHDAKISEANALIENEEYEAAADIFREIGETGLADDAIARKTAAEEAKRVAEEEEKRRMYQAREEEGNRLLSAGDFDGALEIYRELGNQELIYETIYQKAAALGQPELYMEIPDYKDSRELHYQAGKAYLDADPGKAYDILITDISYSDAISVLYDMADRESKAGNYSLSSTVFSALSLQPLDPQDPKSDCLMRCFQDQYQYGLQLQQQGNWDAAAEIFDRLGNLGDAYAHALESRYAIACSLEESEKYTQAAAAFDALGDYSDSAERVNQNRYSAAKKLLESGFYENAETAFRELGDYEDAETMTKECRYQNAVSLYNAGMYEQARSLFESLTDYMLSVRMRDACDYQIAEQYLNKGFYSEAKNIYEQIRDYEDAANKLNTCNAALGDQEIAKAEDLLRSGETEKAAVAYQIAYSYYQKTDNTVKTDELALMVAHCYHSVNNLNSALDWYRKDGDIGRLGIAGIAEFALQTEQEEIAEAIALSLDSDEGNAILYRMACMKRASDDRETALRLFSEAGDYDDANEQYDKLKYLIAEDKIDAGEFAEAEAIAAELGGTYYQSLVYLLAEKHLSLGNEDEAIRLFDAAGEYKDSKERHDELLYQRADKLISDGNHLAAIDILGLIPEYKDAAKKKKETTYIVAENPEQAGEYDGDAGKAVRDAQMLYVNDMTASKDYASAIAVLESMAPDTVILARLNSAKYMQAKKLEKESRFEEAIAIFLDLGSYLNAGQCAANARYQQAMFFKESAEYDQAIESLKKIPGYEDSGDQVLECTYLKAEKLLNEKSYTDALAAYQSIIEYKDVRSIITGNRELQVALNKWQHNIQAGEKVILGHSESGELLSWLVLDRDGNKLLLISEKIIRQGKFEEKPTRTTWQHSTLRKKLNEEWINQIFSEEETQMIQLTQVKAEKSKDSTVSPGNNTEDYLFVLNEQENARYRDYLYAVPADQDWWLRSPGKENNTIKISTGNATAQKSVSANSVSGIRPALWIDENAILVYASGPEEQTSEEETVVTSNPDNPESVLKNGGSAEALPRGTTYHHYGVIISQTELRTNASSDSSVVCDPLDPEEHVYLIYNMTNFKKEIWTKVRYKGQEGYVKSEYIFVLSERDNREYESSLSRQVSGEPITADMLSVGESLNQYGELLHSANLRSSPSENSALVNNSVPLLKGEHVYLIINEVNSKNEIWTKVKYREQEGYIKGANIRVLDDDEN